MKTVLRPALLALWLTAGFTSMPAAPAVQPGADRITVIFDHPEKFTDLKDHASDYENEWGRERYLPFIKEYLEKRAGKMLPEGQKLTITFTDIDLAGDFEPWRGMSFDDVRIVKSIHWPRMHFNFTLTDASGQVLKEGERKLTDSAFQMRITSSFNSDQLRYEKEMLNDWLRKDVLPRKG